jgi:geranylgeranyl pyrophosphate synthase
MDSYPAPQHVGYNSKYFDKLYLADFRRIHAASKRIANDGVSRKDQHLRSLIRLALDDQSPTEYPFLFRYSYGEIEEDGQGLETICAAIHLLQTSTFIIDDIFDESGVRNHSETLFGKYGVNYAVVVGEILQTAATKTIDLEIERGTFENKWLALKILHEVLRKVYIGQYLDIYNSSNPHITTREYYRVISFTTGYFLSDIARCGALLAGKSEPETDALADYGYNYGMALQVTDDIVDIVVPPRLTGKTFASDLKCHRMRLPFILALNMADQAEANCLKEFLSKADPSDSEIKYVAKLIRNCGAVQECTAIANSFLNESLKCLGGLEKSLTTESLRWLSERLLNVQTLSK